MALDTHMLDAVTHYVRQRGQMGSIKAAAHTCQKFGVTAKDLAASLADEKLLLVNLQHIDSDEDEEIAA